MSWSAKASKNRILARSVTYRTRPNRMKEADEMVFVPVLLPGYNKE